MVYRLVLALGLSITHPALLSAELTYWQITQRELYAGGQPCGERGVYERWRGKIGFAIDPRNLQNQQVVDLSLAPLNPEGRVEFSADVEMLVPVDRSKANGTLFYEVNNRGNKTAPNIIERDASEFLCRQGYVVLWSGWIAEVQPDGSKLRLQAPSVIQNGRRVRGKVRNELVVDQAVQRASISHRGNQGSYPPAADALDRATVTRRPSESAGRMEVPRNQWKLLVSEVERNGERGQLPLVELEIQGGLHPGWIYEVCYEAEGAIVQGCGLAGIRDLISSLKFSLSETTNPLLTADGRPLISRAVGFGTSQSGRCLRQFLWDGFNADEERRKVFDGVICHVAGGGLGSFNHRFASPTRTNGQHEEHLFPADYFPFAYGDDRDPGTGAEDAILRRARESGTVPKVFHTQTSSEYWHRSGSLVHTDPLGKRDSTIPPDVRLYTFGGTQHSPGSGIVGARGSGSLPTNPADYRPLMRALVVAMNDWITRGVQPPPSLFPKIGEQTLVDWQRTESGWPSIPGVDYPHVIHVPAVLDRGSDWLTRRIATVEPPEIRGHYVVRIPAVDADGNERGTLNLPAIAVPVATYTSWNLRAASIGAAGALLSLQGGYVPFARNGLDREKTNDPRPSLAERYRSYEEYESLYLQAAERLLKERYLLDEDLPRLKALCQQFRPLF